MKNLFIVLTLMLLFSVNIFAGQIEQKTAKRVAKNWIEQTALFQRHLPQRHFNITKNVAEIKNSDAGQETIAYLFPLMPRGYIIVAAQDFQKPILVYSDDALFDLTESKENVALHFIRKNYLLQKKAMNEGLINEQTWREQWQALSDSLAVFKAAGTTAEIYGPHLTSVWGQGSVWNSVRYEYERVFNRFTPNYWSVGCVALAMAQNLHYYEWPLTGVGSHSYTEDDAGTLSADFGETDYGWSEMLDNYGNQLTTNEQKNAAGELAYHCAVSVNMDFEEDGSTSSTSDVPYALHSYFRYTGHYETPGGYANFYSRMRTNMQNGRVDIIALSDGSYYGHTVNVDGYDGNNGYYHLNMGWLGSSNGWYNLEGSFNAGGYTSVTGAVLDIFPEPQMGYYYFSETDPKTFTVTWKTAQHLNSDYYQLQQKHGDSGTWTTLSSSVADTFYTVTVSGDGTYYYRVRAHVDGYWWDDSYSLSKGVHVTSDGDYRTLESGNWNDEGIWEVYNSGWDEADVPPDYNDGRITIQSGHTVQLTQNVTADELVIQSDAQLTIQNGVDLSVNNGLDTDLRVYGTLRKEGTARILYSGSGTTTSKFYDGSLFQMAGSNKYILVAEYEPQSTIEFSGAFGGDMTSTYHSDQTFGNFIWDCSGQTDNVYFSGNLTDIRGDFKLRNTKGYELRLTGTAGSDPTVRVRGSMEISGGILNMTSGDNNIYLVCYGDFTQSGGEIKATGAGTGYLRLGPIEGGGYDGIFEQTGGIFTPEDIQVNNVFEFILHSNMNTGSAPFTVNGTLNCGAYEVSGNSFTLSSSGRIKIGHADGLNGNIKSTTKSFSAAGDYEYIANGAQVTGTDLPTSLTDGLIIDAVGNVTLSQSTTLSGGNTGLVLRSGRLNTSDENLFTLAHTGGWWGGSDASFVNGPMVKIRESTSAFSFPTGKNETFRRCRIIPSSSDQTYFKAEYFDEAFSNIQDVENGLDHVSNVEYWRIERTSGTADAQVGLYWEENSGVESTSSVRVAYWDGQAWQDKGAAEVEGSPSSGRVTSFVVNEFGTFTLGFTEPSDISDAIGAVPKKFKLHQNYPNPFNNFTKIKYDLPESGKTELVLYNVLGQKVKTLFSGMKKHGSHSYLFDATEFSSGIYFYRLKNNDKLQVRKLILIK